MTHRLFFGIRPPPTLRDALIDTMDGIEGARWQDDDQLHLTLRYVGEVSTPMANDLADGALAIRFAPFDLSIAGCGVFERKGHAHTLYAGVQGGAGLERLVRRFERICQSCGLLPETRKFHPHITLARLNRSCGPLSSFLARHAAIALGPWQVSEYILYRSHLRKHGSFYEPIVTYPATT